MKQLTIFRILTFILLPIAAMFGFMDILFLLSALANPALLLIAFILGAFVIYTFVSLQFLLKGIDTGRQCKPSLRDWIRVNAFVSSFMGIMFLLNALSIFFTNDLTLREYVSQFMQAQPNIPSMLNLALFMTIMKGMAWFMFFLAIFLLVHIQLNFRLLKMYGHLFNATKPE
ncbi:MAG: hypothetical protein V4539_15535 [Bacteroidota bacterium]